MEELVPMIAEGLDKLGEIASILTEISNKLDNINGIYGIDDVMAKLDETAGETIGPSESDITSILSEISSKLDNINGVYGIDDVVAKVEEAAQDIMGPTGYNLTDIFAELSAIRDKD